MTNSYKEKPKTDNPSWAVSHHRSRELKEADRCEICESTKKCRYTSYRWRLAE